jgi:hypothetical protein
MPLQNVVTDRTCGSVESLRALAEISPPAYHAGHDILERASELDVTASDEDLGTSRSGWQGPSPGYGLVGGPYSVRVGESG